MRSPRNPGASPAAPSAASATSLSEVVTSLLGGLSCQDCISRYPFVVTASGIENLYAIVLQLARENLQRAHTLAEATLRIAQHLGDPRGLGLALRAHANVLYLQGQHQAAIEHYQQAVESFLHANAGNGDPEEVARTRSSAIQTLAYLARYEDALHWGEQARAVFEAHGDQVRLARLDGNLANLYFRLDRFQEALSSYERARDAFRQCGSPQDIAAVLGNLATCYISVGRFHDALSTYREAREHNAKHGFSLLVAQADYNIAYLHLQQGDHREAMRLYADARRHSAAVGDFYHATLCDLDQAEMMLELNLLDEAERLARLAAKGFRKLEMRYERAKASAFLAISLARRGDILRAQRVFAQSRRLFLAEKNLIWTALIDLHLALIDLRSGLLPRARTRAKRALNALENRQIPGKLILAELTLSSVLLAEGATQDAESLCCSALSRAEVIQSPGLIFQCRSLLSTIHQQRGASRDALACLEAAREALDLLRAGVPDEELRIRFLEDKAAIFERLVLLHLEDELLPRDPAAAWFCVQSAKSRTFLDAYAQRSRSQQLDGPAASSVSLAGNTLSALRRDLHQAYLGASEAELRGDSTQAAQWRQRAHRSEKRMKEELAQLRLLGNAHLALDSECETPLAAISQVQATLAPGEALIEYFCTPSRVFAFVVNPNGDCVVKGLADTPALRSLARLSLFQISSYHNRRTHGSPQERQWPALASHLVRLHQALLAPILPLIQAQSLVVAPHGFLHGLPFAALGSPEHPLAAEFTIRRALSASAYAASPPLSRHDPSVSSTGGCRALVLGLPDEQAPLIAREVDRVTAMLPHAQLRLGSEASLAVLREQGRNAPYIHIASHGLFRSDNPMFSAIRLADGNLNLYELQEISLSARLVTLSGCSTGVNAVVGGDELIGLSRGFFQAGAHSLLVALWDVNDLSTAQFMEYFYAALSSGSPPDLALRDASLRLRQEFPHPYHWAAFSLMVSGRYRNPEGEP